MSSQNMTIFFWGGGISVHFRYRLKYLLGVAKKQNLFGYA